MIAKAEKAHTKDCDPFLDFLVQRRLLTKDQADVVMEEWQLGNQPIDALCLEMGFIKPPRLLAERAAQGDILTKKVQLSSVELQQTRYIGIDFCKEACLVPLNVDKSQPLTIVMAEMHNVEHKDRIYSLFPGKKISFALGLRSEIMACLQHHFPHKPDFNVLIKNLDSEMAEVHKPESKDVAGDLIQALFCFALRQGFSDLHMEPFKKWVRVRYRLDGVLQNLFCFHKKYWALILSRLKVMSRLDVAQNQRSQQGQITFETDALKRDLRVSLHPTVEGERVVVRVLDQPYQNLSRLGYKKAMQDQLYHFLSKPEGLFIMTGPTGSGKTTTLHALLEKRALDGVNVMSLEDPVEYRTPRVSQTDLTRLMGWGFEEGIASVLRQDIDVLLVGEIRHPKVAQSALRAAMTGHQVLTSLHAKDGFSTIDRLLEFDLSKNLIVDYVEGVLSQRLVRILCPLCKKVDASSPLGGDVIVYKPSGCEACLNTGYKGRTAIAEWFDKASIRQYVTTAQKTSQGFSGFQAEACQLCAEGLLSLEEWKRVLGSCLFPSTLKRCA